MAKGDVLFAATGVTDGNMLSGVKFARDYIRPTQSSCAQVRRRFVKSRHGIRICRSSNRAIIGLFKGGIAKMPPFVSLRNHDNRTFFLGIRKSVTGQKWMDRLGPREANTALAIAQHHGISDLVSRVLAGRGVSVEGAPEFIDPSLRNLMPDPAMLTDMDKAANRIADAIMRRETVAIFGDYDVDGACSSALMARF